VIYEANSTATGLDSYWIIVADAVVVRAVGFEVGLSVQVCNRGVQASQLQRLMTRSWEEVLVLLMLQKGLMVTPGGALTAPRQQLQVRRQVRSVV
jgi:hypothetical protein